MGIQVSRSLKMQQVRDLFGAMKAEGKDFVTMEEFLAYYDSAKVGKNGELYAFRWMPS